MHDNTLLTLRKEFEARPGSFLLQLRSDLRWDTTAFSQVTEAMHTFVSQRATEEPIPRWIAEGFWYLGWFVRDWSEHPNFPRQHDHTYYAHAYERLHDLASWLFIGQSPYEEGQGFEPLQVYR